MQMADSGHSIILWTAVGAGSVAAATGVYWVAKKALDTYVPYQVRF